MKSYRDTGPIAELVAMLIALPAFGLPNPNRDAYFGETHVHTSW